MESMSERLPPSLAFSSAHSCRNSAGMQAYRLEIQNRDRLFTSQNVTVQEGDADQRSHVNFSNRLPCWLWSVIAAALGINQGDRTWRRVIALTLQMLTIVSGLMFAVCGLFFNVYDVLSNLTKTTILVAVAKLVPGAYWIGIGIYAHSLAGRLFSNPRFVDSIRMHSKTVFKVNLAVIIMILSVIGVTSNLYWTSSLLETSEDKPSSNSTRVRDANCVTAQVDVRLCQVFYFSRVVYAVLTLIWNLLVASILLSVCRTHTICIRRFMRELIGDSQIYEEFVMMKICGEGLPPHMESSVSASDRAKLRQTFNKSMIWDDDILDNDQDDPMPTSSMHILQSIQSMRWESYDVNHASRPTGRALNIFGSSDRLENQATSPLQHFPPPFNQDDEDLLENHTTNGQTHRHRNSVTTNTARSRQNSRKISKGDNYNIAEETTDGRSGRADTDERATSGYDGATNAGLTETGLKEAIESGTPPLITNEDMLYTYFQIVRRLSATSRLLQRWLLSLIIFIFLWCGLLMVYWTQHSADWPGLIEFCIPLGILYFLSSAYAEVNFEGCKLFQCIMPTAERMTVLYYMRQVPLELKVYSFQLSYSSIITVLAGVALTFASRIILEQVGL